MANYNPYQAPASHVEDIAYAEDIELAGRGARLGAAMIDTVFFLLIILPLWLIFTPGIFSGHPPGLLLSTGLALLTLVIWIALNFSLLARKGQTLGKKMLGIKIVRSDATPCPASRIAGLRMIVPTALSQIPIAGMIFGFADALFIFRESRRTLHDLIADTIVIRA